ncbi:hypothetical protein Glove_137g123 [Diversispora epigaea]|uniref:Uncharacterized protein n=1 Tax=Diversispora epigaea TaxID=1348612 RepID=A0A397J0W5_9GLOM|nr:hypothetical protein Glove_137g123 [Diversispora epigaea]
MSDSEDSQLKETPDSLSQMTRGTFDSAKDVGTSAYETASRIRHGYMQTLNSYIGQPTRKYTNYLWENFPPVHSEDSQLKETPDSLSQMTRGTFDSAKDVGTSAYETASRIRHGYMQTLNSYIGQPTRKYTNYLWENFPPVRWLIYSLCALNSIPLAVFIGWSILTFGVVTALAGVGIAVSQGFFIFLGFAVFVPVSFCLLCLAGIGATIATGLWASFGAANFGLVQLGFVKNQKNPYGHQHVLEAGIRDRDTNRVRK